jgi:DnaJ-class molecular chaperone
MLKPTREQRSHLAQLDLDETATLQDVKMRYKQLVKRFHPDANGGDKQAEERFKSINEAYSNLKSAGLPQG